MRAFVCVQPAAALAFAGFTVAAPGALAQSANCETFKARVAASIEAKGIRGYALDLVPGRTAAPPGSRSVGTCDGGAYTLLYRRWAGAGVAAAAPAAATATASAADAQPTAEPASAGPSKAEPKGATRAAAKSKPAPPPKPAAEPAPAAAAVATPPVSQAPPPEPSATRTAAVSQATTGSAAAAPSPGIAPAAPVAPPAAAPSTTSFDDTARPVVWAAIGMLVAYAGVRLWRRWRHNRYYDEAGLPRGPRMTL